MQKLYEKHVPAPVRQYIESREADDQPKPARPSRPAAVQKNVAEDEQ